MQKNDYKASQSLNIAFQTYISRAVFSTTTYVTMISSRYIL